MKEIKDINQYFIKQFDEFEESLNGEKNFRASSTQKKCDKLF